MKGTTNARGTLHLLCLSLYILYYIILYIISYILYLLCCFEVTLVVTTSQAHKHMG